MNRILGWFAVLVLAMCSATWAQGPETVVTDSLGRSVHIPVPVRRVVSLSASGVECIRIMERMDTLVGITEHTKTRKAQFPEVARLPSVGRGFMPNFEVIAELRPDVILAWKTNPGPELERQLEPLGIAVLRLDLTEPGKLPEEMRTLASILGPGSAKAHESLLGMGGALDGADTKKHSRSAKANCAGGAFHALEDSGAGLRPV